MQIKNLLLSNIIFCSIAIGTYSKLQSYAINEHSINEIEKLSKNKHTEKPLSFLEIEAQVRPSSRNLKSGITGFLDKTFSSDNKNEFINENKTHKKSHRAILRNLNSDSSSNSSSSSSSSSSDNHSHGYETSYNGSMNTNNSNSFYDSYNPLQNYTWAQVLASFVIGYQSDIHSSKSPSDKLASLITRTSTVCYLKTNGLPSVQHDIPQCNLICMEMNNHLTEIIPAFDQCYIGVINTLDSFRTYIMYKQQTNPYTNSQDTQLYDVNRLFPNQWWNINVVGGQQMTNNNNYYGSGSGTQSGSGSESTVISQDSTSGQNTLLSNTNSYVIPKSLLDTIDSEAIDDKSFTADGTPRVQALDDSAYYTHSKIIEYDTHDVFLNDKVVSDEYSGNLSDIVGTCSMPSGITYSSSNNYNSIYVAISTNCGERMLTSRSNSFNNVNYFYIFRDRRWSSYYATINRLIRDNRILPEHMNLETLGVPDNLSRYKQPNLLHVNVTDNIVTWSKEVDGKRQKGVFPRPASSTTITVSYPQVTKPTSYPASLPKFSSSLYTFHDNALVVKHTENYVSNIIKIKNGNIQSNYKYYNKIVSHLVTQRIPEGSPELDPTVDDPWEVATPLINDTTYIPKVKDAIIYQKSTLEGTTQVSEITAGPIFIQVAFGTNETLTTIFLNNVIIAGKTDLPNKQADEIGYSNIYLTGTKELLKLTGKCNSITLEILYAQNKKTYFLGYSGQIRTILQYPWQITESIRLLQSLEKEIDLSRLLS